jgi:Cu/Zn superoxide dismutase
MHMRTAIAAGVAVVFASTLAAAQQGGSQAQHGREAAGKVSAKARATIAGEGISGTAEFTEMSTDTGKEVVVTVSVKGLKPGLHGVHLHAVGKCEAPSFTAAGGHFDPGPAGNTDPDANHPYHMGDIPNLRVGADGSRDALRWAAIGVRLRRHRDHHPRQRGSGDHGGEQVRRERRTARRVRCAREGLVK